VAVDAAAHHIAMGVRPAHRPRRRGGRVI
jgi:hypothetical protein